MLKLFDVSTSTGQFVALLILYLINVALRTLGHHWIQDDHTLILGALLALLKPTGPHPTITSVEPSGSVQVRTGGPPPSQDGSSTVVIEAPPKEKPKE